MLIEVVILLVLLASALSGYRKGMLMSLCTLLVLVLCSLGASAAQRQLTPRAVEYMTPKLQATIQESMEEKLQEGASEALEDAGEVGITIGGQSVTLGDLMELLSRFGLDVQTQVKEGSQQAMEPMLEEAAYAVALAMVQPAAELVIYLAAFLILYLALHSVALAVNVVDRLPVIHTLNRLGGALLGLLGGALLLTVILTVLRQAGWIPEGALQGPMGVAFKAITDILT